MLGESLTLALSAGALGIGLAYLVSLGGDPTGGLLPIFMFTPTDIAIGLVLAIVLGLIAGAMPAAAAMRLRIAEALRRS